MTHERELEGLAIAVHGALSILHLLGLVYNVRRKNTFDSVVHALAAAYDLNAVRIHAQALSSTNCE